MRSNPRLFSSSSALAASERELLDEVKCYYLHHHLLKIKQTYAQDNNDVEDTRFAQFLQLFEQVLITHSRTQAIDIGRAFVFAGYAKLKTCLDKDEHLKLLGEAGITLNDEIDSVSFGTNYVKSQSLLDELVNIPYHHDVHDAISEGIISLAKCKSFRYMKLIIDKLPPEALLLLQEALDSAFYSAIRFGDVDSVEYLLSHGVNANQMQSLHPDKKQQPLALVVRDLSRCMSHMNQLMCEAQQDQPLVGDFKDLESALESRLCGYKLILEELLSKGADPDSIPDQSFVDELPPRKIASLSLASGVPLIANSGLHLQVHMQTIIDLLMLIIKAPELGCGKDHEAMESGMKRFKR